MKWLESLQGIEELEDAEFDAALVAEMERFAPANAQRMIRFSTPTFKEYESSELQSCGKNSFPAFSITAGGCALMCDHCEAKILEPMIPATRPEVLDHKVRHLIEMEELQGFLLSGGSNKRNEIRYTRFYPVIEKAGKLFLPQLWSSELSYSLNVGVENRTIRCVFAGADRSISATSAASNSASSSSSIPCRDSSHVMFVPTKKINSIPDRAAFQPLSSPGRHLAGQQAY
jgi:hypothetical protein